MLSIVTRTPVVDHPYLEKCKDSVEKALTKNSEHKIIIIDNIDSFNRKTFECKDFNEYIAFVDYDDYIHPDSITRCLDAISKYDLDVVFTDEKVIHLNNGYKCSNYTGRRKYSDLIKDPTAIHHLVVMRSSLIDVNALLLAEKYGVGIEWFMICSAVFKGKVMHIPKQLYTWTRSPGQRSQLIQRTFRLNMENMRKDIKDTWNVNNDYICQINHLN